MRRPPLLFFTLLLASAVGDAAERPPNVVVIFCDDLGYGDLGCFGHPTIATPNLDRMADEGLRWTQFYVAASVCTPSRAGLMTGRLPIRNGMCGTRRVLFPDSGGGLPDDEYTIAEALQSVNYATACIGKWHLGHLPQFLPTAQGFDSYFGIPYSNDMDAVRGTKNRDAAAWATENYNVPLLRSTAPGNVEVVERPVDQTTITKRYTEEAVRFIEQEKDGPFFLYLAHSMPHIPLFRSEEFTDVSLRGLYGDVIEEIDWSVGEVLKAVEEAGVDENTLVWFTSDNGPWLIFGRNGGSAGLLRGGKGGTFEGGMREPTVCRWPGTVPAGTVCRDLGSTLDFLPTFAALADAQLPADRVLDGVDLTPVLRGTGPSPRETMFYYRARDLYAVRHGAFKAHFVTRPEYGPGKTVRHDPPLLYDLNVDPSEKYDVAADHPDVVAEIKALAAEHTGSFTPPPSQLMIKLDEVE